MIIILKGKTLHGKNRVREHGERWRKLNATSPLRKGEISIESVKTGGGARWVHPTNDPDFEVTERCMTSEELNAAWKKHYEEK